jgi:hypothetical protein
MKKRPVLIDLDETAYPFIHTVDRWMVDTLGTAVDWDALVWVYDLDLFLPHHVERQPDYAAHLSDFDPQPITGAVEALRLIAEHYPIVACTARNEEDWSAPTRAWVATHLPFVADVIFVRADRGTPAVPKAVIANDLHAVALIDDTADWMAGLPERTTGFVVKRPAPLASDVGAVSWETIAAQLTAQALRRR